MVDAGYPGELLLSREDAETRAAEFSRLDSEGEFDESKVPKPDPFGNQITASLLSAEDIKRYVLATGMIAPFYVGGGRYSLLKDASYEGRIGRKAFIYEPEKNEPRDLLADGKRVLELPPNSIVFVECDLDFRIPEFIALRFNLQIKHVHRGLLLGTGPLVDPGYFGKLCIPLHNLTDEAYEIPLTDGLIWIEFTRTTANFLEEGKMLGRPPLGRAFWNIEEFLEKASKHYDGAKSKVGIRSSIPTETRKASLQATEASQKAASAANEASNAATQAKRASDMLTRIGIGASVVAGIALVALIVALYSLAHSYRVTTEDRLSELGDEIAQVRTSLMAITSQLEDRREVAATGVEETGLLQSRIVDLIEGQRTLLDRVQRLENEIPPQR